MYSLPHVTNTILKRARDMGTSLTPMKLQKLLYFLYKSYLKRMKSPLFSERFEPWQYGPVVADVYDAFKNYQSNPIKRFFPDADGSSRYVDTNVDNDMGFCINDIWKKYAPYTGIELSVITHREDGAWAKAIKANCPVLLDDDIRIEPDYEAEP